jgi:hypothetical protein
MAVTYYVVLVILLLFLSIPLITILHDIIYMESSYLKILTSSASTYQKFGNIYRKLLSTTSCEIKVIIMHTEKKTELRIFKIKGSTKLDAIYNGVNILCP